MSALPLGECAGFVLAGGQSSRMGRPKALLPVNGVTLVERVANVVERAAGSVVILGPLELYSGLGREVVPDTVTGIGPLGGIAAALALQRARLNLVVACDMPDLDAGLLSELLDRARASQKVCCIPTTNGLPEPLCAVYKIQALPAILEAIGGGIRKVSAALAAVDVDWWELGTHRGLTNLNTPREWETWSRG